MKWSRFGLITVGSSRTLFLWYAAVTAITSQSFQESTRRRFEHVELKSTPSIARTKHLMPGQKKNLLPGRTGKYVKTIWHYRSPFLNKLDKRLLDEEKQNKNTWPAGLRSTYLVRPSARLRKKHFRNNFYSENCCCRTESRIRMNPAVLNMLPSGQLRRCFA